VQFERFMESIRSSYYRYLRYFLSKDDASATPYDKYMALAYAVRSELVDKWIKTQQYYHEHSIRRVYYLTMEYVLGKNLHQNVINAGLEKEVEDTARAVGFSLDELYEQEDDFELGNSGKGRLAACFQESMATHGIPAMGYGIRYDYAAFHQRIVNGRQVERPYDWLHKGHPWEIMRPEYACRIRFGGSVLPNGEKTSPHKWESSDIVLAVPADLPIPGFQCPTVNTIRLWSARASEEFLADYLNHQDYIRACDDISLSGSVTKVLYPEEDVLRVTAQRIRQHYFLISASLQDIIRRHKRHNLDMATLDQYVAIQLSGSRCALAVPELVRLLVDEELVPWDKAWAITQNVFAYTSHAVVYDNLEMWPAYLVQQILPRHMDIIYEINQRYLDRARTELHTDLETIRDVSVIEEGEVKRVRMAQLCILGSSSINGVSTAQTELLMKKVFPRIHAHVPQKFVSITSGVAHRRWLLSSNSLLAALINEAIGEGWVRDPERLRDLESFVFDNSFLDKLENVKRICKDRLLISVKRSYGMDHDATALFDVQCKRIHPHKRQVLNILNILSRYLRIKNGEKLPGKRLHIFSGKAAPSDFLAKQIVALIHLVADIINKDPLTRDYIEVLFIPDYGVSWAEKIIPATELSEEIATPGTEASGTTAFKMCFNGAIPIVSKCGSNLEIIEQIGADNLFIFGQTLSEIESSQNYRPGDIIRGNHHLSAIFKLLEDMLASSGERGESIYPLVSTLRDVDRHRVLPAFTSYIEQQNRVDTVYQDRRLWQRMSLYTIARIGWFSSDRMVAEYARHIWKVNPRES
jgi:glycogen phosphorylase